MTPTTTTAPDLATIGRAYIEGGLSIIPVGRDKRPLSNALPRDPETDKPTWKPFQDAPPDAATVERWARTPGVVGFAAVCGMASSGLVVLDFDVPAFYEQWREAVGDMAGELPTQRTGGGGYQAALRCDEPAGNDKLAWAPDESEETGRTVAIETRGEGGYAVLPHSKHRSGNRYQAIAGDWCNVPRVEMSRVRFMLDAARQLDEAPMTRQQIERAAKAKPKPRASRNGQAGIIEQWNQQRPLADVLERNGYRQSAVEGRMIRPSGSSPSVYLFTDREPARSFHHSSNDPLHDPQHSRDSFDVFTEMEHGGDVGEAVKAAAQELGIDRPQPSRDAPVSGELILDPGAPLDSTRQFIEAQYTSEGQRTIHHQAGMFYRWWNNAYTETDAGTVRAELYNFAEGAQQWQQRGDELKLVPFNPTKPKVDNLADALRAACNLPASVQPPSWLDGREHPPADELLPMRNGLLHLPERKLHEADPRFYAHHALDFAYQPDAPEPRRWHDFLLELWPDDPAAIFTLQELFGYLLTTDTRQHKIFLLVGPKRSGKGTIARVLRRLLGEANVAGPTLSSLGQNFGMQPLIGKLLAVISDARLGGHSDQAAIAERLLSISGEDAISIDRKHLPAWTGKLPTRFLILTNELPRIGDSSGALASRFVVLTLSNSFYGREDTGLYDKLVPELPGILNWAIEGWANLRERGHFITPESSAEAVRELEDLGSPVGAFIRERCIVGPEQHIEAGELYQAWRQWCERNGRDHPGTAASFGRDLRAAEPGITTSRPNWANKRVVYQGIGLDL